MQFVKQFELVIVFTNNQAIIYGVYESYEEAYDAAIIEASKNLPIENVKGFTINETYLNKAVAGG